MFGIPIIDHQHAKFFDFLDKLSEIPEEDEKAIIALLGKIEIYTKTHFRTEEKLLEEYGYNGFNFHKQVHERFKAEVATLIKKCKSGNMPQKRKIESSLSEWLRHHIVQVDREYRDFLKFHLEKRAA